MDDFGPSVWDDAPISPNRSRHASPSLDQTTFSTIPLTTVLPDFDNEFKATDDLTTLTGDAFDDFGSPSVLNEPRDDDFADEFGDFGDFGDAGFDDGGFGQVGTFDDGGFVVDELPPEPGPSTWEPLRLHPMPSPKSLINTIDQLLAPAYAHIDPETIMSRDGIRQVEGLGQTLASSESRELFRNLLQANTPPIRPPNWTRSRIRRQHLISLGIPVNLDEILPQSSIKALPALNITTRPMSAPPGPRPERNGRTSVVQGRSRVGTPQPSPGGGRRTPQATASSSLSIGPKPTLERERIEQALLLDLATLPLLPLPTLVAHLDTLRSLTASTSGVLSHLLQTRDALQQDSETYNRLIAELVGEAQKMKTGGRNKPVKRGSGYA